MLVSNLNFIVDFRSLLSKQGISNSLFSTWLVRSLLLFCVAGCASLSGGLLAAQSISPVPASAMQDNDSQPTDDGTQATTNGWNSNESRTTQSTFTAQPLPPTPQPPQTFASQNVSQFSHSVRESWGDDQPGNDQFGHDNSDDDQIGHHSATMLMPSSPTEDSFTAADDLPLQAESLTRDSRTTFTPSFNQNDLRAAQNSLPPRPTQDLQAQSNLSQQPPAEQNSPQPIRIINATENSGNQLRQWNAPVSVMQDERVQLTAFTQSNQATQATQTTSVNRSADSNIALAVQLIERYQVSRAPDPLPGQPVRLLQMLQQPLSNQQREAMVSQYWETWFDWASLLSRAEQLNWLESINAPAGGVDADLLNTAKSAARDHMLAAEIQLGRSQSILNDFIPNHSYAPGQPLPLPSDLPLIQRYKTNYELYQSYQMIPPRLRGINTMLPKTLELIGDRAETVQLAINAANQARQAFTQRQTGVTTVLEAARLRRLAEQDLIASVMRYNQAIADYSLTITSGSQSPEQIAAMLIAKPKSVVGSSGQSGQSGQNFGMTTQQPLRALAPVSSNQGGFSGQSLNSNQPSTANQQNRLPQSIPRDRSILSESSNSSSQFSSQFGQANPAQPNQDQPSQFQPSQFQSGQSAQPRQFEDRSANQSFGQPGNDFQR